MIGKECIFGDNKMEWVLFFATLIAALILVIKSADTFVDNILEIGSALGISEIVLGVTASAIGTSLPEFGSAMIAVLTGNPEVGVGCAIGANIWNIAGILGISTIAAGIITAQKMEVYRDGLMTLLTSVVWTAAILVMGSVNWIISIILILMYIIYLWILIKAQKKHAAGEMKCCEINDEKKLNKKTIMWGLAGVAGLAIGCRVIVYCTVELSTMANISAGLAGILLAFGTTTPEFFTVLTSARKGLNSLALGTVFGSNVFNILIGLGLPALLVTIPVEPAVIYFDSPAMVLITILALILVKRGSKLTRIEGIILVASFLIYMGSRLFLVS